MFNPDVTEFHKSNKDKINKQCDIYAIGAILFRLLLGVPPSPEIAEHIAKNRLSDKTPKSNVYEVPYFLNDFVLSNDMCHIICRLLHMAPKHRYPSLVDLRTDLLRLKENIL